METDKQKIARIELTSAVENLVLTAIRNKCVVFSFVIGNDPSVFIQRGE